MSRDVNEDFRQFFKNNRHFCAHHMSHRREGEVPHRGQHHHLRGVDGHLRQLPANTAGFHVVGVAATPIRTGSPVALRLALGLRTDPVPRTRPRVLREPASADRARALVGHRTLVGVATLPGLRLARPWPTFHEHTRPDSGEQRSRLAPSPWILRATTEWHRGPSESRPPCRSDGDVDPSAWGRCGGTPVAMTWAASH